KASTSCISTIASANSLTRAYAFSSLSLCRRDRHNFCCIGRNSDRIEVSLALLLQTLPEFEHLTAKHSLATDAFWHFYRLINAARLTAIGDDHLFDRDEGSELRHQTIFQAKLRDRFAHVFACVTALKTFVILAHQIVNPPARPQRRQHIVLRLRVRQSHRNLADEMLPRHLALQANRAARARSVTPAEHDWFGAE